MSKPLHRQTERRCAQRSGVLAAIAEHTSKRLLLLVGCWLLGVACLSWSRPCAAGCAVPGVHVWAPRADRAAPLNARVTLTLGGSGLRQGLQVRERATRQVVPSRLVRVSPSGGHGVVQLVPLKDLAPHTEYEVVGSDWARSRRVVFGAFRTGNARSEQRPALQGGQATLWQGPMLHQGVPAERAQPVSWLALELNAPTLSTQAQELHAPLLLGLWLERGGQAPHPVGPPAFLFPLRGSRVRVGSQEFCPGGEAALQVPELSAAKQIAVRIYDAAGNASEPLQLTPERASQAAPAKNANPRGRRVVVQPSSVPELSGAAASLRMQAWAVAGAASYLVDLPPRFDPWARRESLEALAKRSSGGYRLRRSNVRALRQWLEKPAHFVGEKLAMAGQAQAAGLAQTQGSGSAGSSALFVLSPDDFGRAWLAVDFGSERFHLEADDGQSASGELRSSKAELRALIRSVRGR